MRKRTRWTTQGRRAFTLIELMVVVTIIAALVGILLPALWHVYGHAERIQCQSNLKQIAMAVLSYTTDHKGAIPPTKVEPAGLYWCNLLVKGNYLAATNAVDLPTGEQSRGNTVLLCPVSSDLYVSEGDSFLKPDDFKAQGWYRLGNDTIQTDCSYYWNGYTGTSPDMRERYPSLLVDTSVANPSASYHNIAEIPQRSHLAMVMDGVFFDGDESPQRIAARHSGAFGVRCLTNIAFYDAHVEALDRHAPGSHPNRDWTQEKNADEESALLPIMNPTLREENLEGGPPFFMLPRR